MARPDKPGDAPNNMIARLEFKHGGVADCELLGSITASKGKYALFKDVRTKDIYIYRYERKKDRLRLMEITNNEEFKEVCNAVTLKVNEGRK